MLTCEIKKEPCSFDPDKKLIVFGGDDRNPTWEEYLSEIKDEYKPHFELLKSAIVESEFYKATGEVFCNDHYFLFSDGVYVSFSWRAWGDLMQAIVGEREGYMTYYM